MVCRRGAKVSVPEEATRALPKAFGGAYLRKLVSEDVEELFACVDRNRARLRQWMPWLDQSKEPSHVENFVRSSIADYAVGRSHRLAIIVEGAISGICGLEEIRPEHLRAKVGYWIDGSLEGKGVVSAAVSEQCEFGFCELELNLVEIYAAKENTRSRAVAERLGFQLEAVLRARERLYDRFVDHAVYSMTRDEWKAQRAASSAS